ncbi:MAG: hypothetical protein KatS3mg031_0397 [Chitinophagales bacterium]|nr:MAG: hypothetical protein KatS3mg031_0397 [Chitinophagales bacterium]
MKKSITLFFACWVLVGTNAYSQSCTPPAPSGDPGISPDWQQLPCVEQGVAYSATINVENFDTLGITSLRIDSIVGLPEGLDYLFDNGQKTKTFAPGATGCASVFGTTNCPVGRYKLGIYATVTLALGSFSNEACVLYGILASGNCPFGYYINVTNAGGVCDTNAPVVSRGDTMAAEWNSFRNCNVVNAIPTVQSIDDITIVPNPFTTQTEIRFTAKESGMYQVSLRDLAGKTVLNEELVVSTGTNRYILHRNNLAEGVYFFTLSKDGKAVTRRITIAE